MDIEKHLKAFGTARGLSAWDLSLARTVVMEWMYELPDLMQPGSSSSSSSASGSAGVSASPPSASPSGSAGVKAKAHGSVASVLADRSRSPQPRPKVRLLATSKSRPPTKESLQSRLAASAYAAKVCGREGEERPHRATVAAVATKAAPRDKKEEKPPPWREDEVVVVDDDDVVLARLQPTPPQHPPPPPLPPPLPAPPSVPELEGRELRGWCQSCGKWRSQCFRRWDWACPACENHNYANRQMCARCGQARHVGQLSQMGSGRLDWSSVCSSHGCPMFMCFKPFDWLCSCGNHNYASKKVPRRGCSDVLVFGGFVVVVISLESRTLGCSKVRHVHTEVRRQ